MYFKIKVVNKITVNITFNKPLFGSALTFHVYLSTALHSDIAPFLPYPPLLVLDFLLHFDEVPSGRLFVPLIVLFEIFLPKNHYLLETVSLN